MPSLPKTALRLDDLIEPADQPKIRATHVVRKVKFTDYDGSVKEGFYKALDENYPLLLALWSVTSSVEMRALVGERAADERLVFDNEGNVVGTLSIAIPNFVSFRNSKEALKTSKLVEWNIIEQFWFARIFEEDDLHDDNIGPQGVLDFDMRHYSKTIHIKGPRTIGSQPLPQFSCEDWRNFPGMEKIPTYWLPGGYLPQNYNIFNINLNCNEFANLAGDPTAQLQLFTAALKFLVTYQPKFLEKKFFDAIGDIPLHYTDIDKDKYQKLERDFPHLFNPKTNEQPFVELKKEEYQQLYDHIYRTLVFPKGYDKNSHGLRVPSFNEFLNEHPEAFSSILKEFCFPTKNQDNNNNNAQEPALPDPVKMEQRYHQIWRDSLIPEFKTILSESRYVIEILLKFLKKEDAVFPEDRLNFSLDTSFEIKSEDIENITQASQLLSDYKQPDVTQIQDKQGSNIREGLLKLVEATKEFHLLIQKYFETPLDKLSLEINSDFYKELYKFQVKYTEIRDCFDSATSWGQICFKIADDLPNLIKKSDFKGHLFQGNIKAQAPRETIRKHTDEDIINESIKALFRYINNLPPEELEKEIQRVIGEDYANASTFMARTDLVLKYLRNSTNESSADRFANILASKTGDDPGSLNSCLVEGFLKKMLEETVSDVNYLLPSLRRAFEEKNFDKLAYTKAAMRCAKTQFINIYSSAGFKSVAEAIFRWVDELNNKNFINLVNSALNKYAPKSWGFGFFRGGGRRAEVEETFKLGNNCKTLAYIFATGGWESNSFNTILLTELLEAIKINLNASKPNNSELLQFEGFRLVRPLLDNNNLLDLSKELKSKSEGITHEVKAAPVLLLEATSLH